MEKMLMTLLTLSVILSMLSVPALAESPTAASGDWYYMPSIVSVRVAGGNTFIESTEEGIWTGTFEGESREAGHVARHRSGFVSFRATVSFDDVTVDGKSGTLQMRVVGEKPDASSDWQGKWVILSGTGELATLRGHGTWWGPGYNPLLPDEWGEIHYGGQIHFEP
jgi:hypothetical protein